ncbi:MAG: ImmA/IrrE family metallo-endopeptidase [Wenzhouxiangella sp.]|jgi:Zn-dependent peptidase ImmA (M78 family)/transcriptional regulator with XRE-family HTH domain|nr:ImmA/IrrE family metallo-endopeptidase [Wenzhouxiangella sp.]
MTRIAVSPRVLQWARERAGLDVAALEGKFPHLADWEAEVTQPTMKQLENFAQAVHVPFGFLFLPEPPEMPLPFADFRTVESRRPQGISPELMDTIQQMQRRQAWLREERMEAEIEPHGFVGAAKLTDDPAAIGREMRRVVGLNDGWAQRVPSWTAAIGELRNAIESLGVMAVVNGVVGNNTHRKLDVREFRGFALSDPYAPLIFINGADAKSAQIFTIAHELAHLWLGEIGEGLSGFQDLRPDGGDVERFCDQAAAEFLVPAAEIRHMWPRVSHTETPFEKLAGHFKVSPVVIGRRAMDLRLVDREEFFSFYRDYTRQERYKKQRATGGGDFYNNQNTRVGRLFASHVMRAAKEGRIGFKEAYDLSGLNGGAFQEYARKLGVTLP